MVGLSWIGLGCIDLVRVVIFLVISVSSGVGIILVLWVCDLGFGFGLFCGLVGLHSVVWFKCWLGECGGFWVFWFLGVGII